MRVLFLSTQPHLPDLRSGLQTTTHDLCLTLREIGAEPAVLCGRTTSGRGRGPARSWEIDESLGYPVIRTDTPEQHVAAVATAWDAAAVVAQVGPRFLRLLVASLDSGRPTAAYLHHVELNPLDGHLVPDPEVLFLANSAFAAVRWARLAGIHCHVVPPVVRHESASGDTTGDRVLFINPVPVKGVELFFAIAASCPEIPFTLVENWELEPTWRDYCQRRAGALGNVEYLERTDDMRPIYAQSRMLLMPSVWEEAFGRSVVEAQLNGLPVLASDRGALPEVVGPGGLTLSPHAPIEDWASAVRAMYADPSHWSDAARSHAFTHAVSAPIIAGDLLSLLAAHALRVAPKSRAGQEASGRITATAATGDLGWRLARLAPASDRRPAVAAEWRALADHLASERRFADAEEAARKAIELADDHAPSWLQLAGILASQQRLILAQQALRRACSLAPVDATPRLALARLQALAGDSREALATLDEVETIRPDWPAAIALRVHVLAEGGRDHEGSPDTAWAHLERLLKLDPQAPSALKLALRLIGLCTTRTGSRAAVMAREWRAREWREASAHALQAYGHSVFRDIVRAAARACPEDVWLSAAELHAGAISGASGQLSLAQQARDWVRSRQSRHWSARTVAHGPALQGIRPRIAYVVEPVGGEFMRRAIVAHDLDAVDVYVFTNAPWDGIPDGIRVLPLVAAELEAQCAKRAIDVAIASGSMSPFDGRCDLLEALASRVAPVQAAWTGALHSTGGLFDALLTDEVALPADRDDECEERILRLSGGQWCWDPPTAAPPPGPLPAAAAGMVTFGVVAAGHRLDLRSMEAFARLLARAPGTRLRLIGRIATDYPLQRQLRGLLERHGVDGERVQFDPRRDLDGFRQWLDAIDVLLEPLAANGGRGTLEALWMGVPVVTLRGDWLGGRQSASMLHAFGASEWVASDPGEYLAIAAALASDLPRLAGARAGLRGRMLAGALVDGRRVASQIEAWAREVVPHASTVRACGDPKERERIHASWEVDGWLARAAAQLQMPTRQAGSTPDFSVIVVLEGQAGLARRALQALADQCAISFETLIVDNASTDRTPGLLDRVIGARVIRNPGNFGFLLAVNRAATLARGRHLLMLRGDVILQPGALQALLRILDGDPSVGAVGGRLLHVDSPLPDDGIRLLPDGSPVPAGSNEEPSAPANRTIRLVDYCSGALMATPRARWERLGGFDRAFVPTCYEDADYCLRVWQSGLRVLCEPRAVARQFGAGREDREQLPGRREANRSRFVERHGAWLAANAGKARGAP